jgi:hypothetical protein
MPKPGGRKVMKSQRPFRRGECQESTFVETPSTLAELNEGFITSQQKDVF